METDYCDVHQTSTVKQAPGTSCNFWSACNNGMLPKGQMVVGRPVLASLVSAWSRRGSATGMSNISTQNAPKSCLLYREASQGSTCSETGPALDSRASSLGRLHLAIVTQCQSGPSRFREEVWSQSHPILRGQISQFPGWGCIGSQCSLQLRRMGWLPLLLLLAQCSRAPGECHTP